MTKEKIIGLFLAIQNAKNSKLKRETLISYMMLRLELKKLYDEYKSAREEIFEQVGNDESKFKPVMQKWLDQEIDIETKIFTVEDCADFLERNPDMNGVAIDAVLNGLLK